MLEWPGFAIADPGHSFWVRNAGLSTTLRFGRDDTVVIEDEIVPQCPGSEKPNPGTRIGRATRGGGR